MPMIPHSAYLPQPTVPIAVIEVNETPHGLIKAVPLVILRNRIPILVGYVEGAGRQALPKQVAQGRRDARNADRRTAFTWCDVHPVHGCTRTNLAPVWAE